MILHKNLNIQSMNYSMEYLFCNDAITNKYVLFKKFIRMYIKLNHKVLYKVKVNLVTFLMANNYILYHHIGEGSK